MAQTQNDSASSTKASHAESAQAETRGSLDSGAVLGTVGGARFWWGVVGIVALAFAVRLAYLYQIEPMPFFYHPVGDAASYWDWAGRIAGGDWLGSETFYQAPAYPYFLALVRMEVGDNLWHVRVVQIALGAVSCGLLVLVGRWFMSHGAGFCAGLIVALYGPAVFFDGLIQKATLSLFLMSALLCLLGWMARGAPSMRSTGVAFAAGVVLGLLALTREQALLLGVVVLMWLVVRRAALHPIARLGAFVLGMALVLGLVAWRNYTVGGEVVLTTVQAGPNFYIGNHDGATGRYVTLKRGHESPPFEREDAAELAEADVGHPLTSREVSDYWLGKAWHYVRQHPVKWMGLLLYKWALVWNAYEIPDTESYTLYTHLSWLLGLCGGINHFGVLCPLAAVGIAATTRRWRDLWLLYVMIAAVAVGVAVFYVFGRYRYPLVPLLAIFAGAGLCEIRSALRAFGLRRLKQPGGARAMRPWTVALVAMAVAIATNVRLNPERELDGMAYANLGVVLGQQHNYAASIHFLERALERVPDSIETHYNLGLAYRFQGRLDLALEHFGRARKLDPQLMEVDYQMGTVYEALGRRGDAIRHYERALVIDPQDEQARQGLERLR